jgi:hypothetical protein
MRGWRFVEEWTLARQKILHECHDIWRGDRRKIEQPVAKTMVKEPVGVAHRLIDRPTAETALPYKVGFKIAKQFSARNLCSRH